MAKDKSFFSSYVVPLRLVFIMWLTFSIEFFNGVDLGFLGIKPRTIWGLIGILTAPMIHGSYLHLISNTFPLLFIGGLLYFFYPKIAGTVFFRAYFFTNILVWLFSPRDSFHIGASGLIYGLTSFLICFGLLRQDFLSFIISVIVLLIYGGVFFTGIVPSDPQVSWESHLAGALIGALTAFNLASQRRVR